MNERIKELAIKAGLLSADYNGFDSNRLTKSEEKFAELLIRECVRYFNEDYKRDFDTLWREDLSKGIKEHFGVEE